MWGFPDTYFSNQKQNIEWELFPPELQEFHVWTKDVHWKRVARYILDLFTTRFKIEALDF